MRIFILLLLSTLLSTLLFSGAVNPSCSKLNDKAVATADKNSKKDKGISTCNNCLVLAYNAKENIHKGVPKDIYLSEIKGDFTEYLAEAEKQAEELEKNIEVFDGALDEAIAKSIYENKAVSKMSHYASMVSESFASLITTINNTAKLDIVGLKISAVLLQDKFSESISGEIEDGEY